MKDPDIIIEVEGEGEEYKGKLIRLENGRYIRENEELENDKETEWHKIEVVFEED